ncbi:MAG TPA: homoserine dehydrogenase [Candidatus Mediterraneibacter vanvlietii]|nr:homoserine dehydrogenase [Candidatus Mediterraneibacter vanvlietii]
MNKIKIGLLGLGTVGTGVYKLIRMRSDIMEKTIGAKLEIKKILVHNKNKKREGVDENLLTDNWKEIVEDGEIQIIVEVIGGIEPARTMILEALRAGKNVVSANKDLIAEQGRELLDTAVEYGKDLLFEAAVAGGIPIIRPLKQCLAANEISDILGIVNGTTNYILTKMFEEGMEFGDALRQAQELGYAEADPTADVEGLDAGRKAAIMASIGFHSRVVFSDVYTEGITKITTADIAYAKEFDSVIKLLAVARNTEDGIEAGVYPMMLPKDHPLSSVRESFNAVFIHGDAVDDAMFYGRGAGEMPTASAVVGDIIDVARDLAYDCTGRISCTCYRQIPVKDFGEVENKFFLRMQVKNQPGVLAKIAQVFGEHMVSIARVVQKNAVADSAELVVVTDRVKEKHMKEALEKLGKMESIYEVSSVIREY